MPRWTDSDERFLLHGRSRRATGLYFLPVVLVGVVVVWGAFYVWWPLSINPLHAAIHYEGQLIEQGAVTTYAVIVTALTNLLFALLVTAIVLSIVWAQKERRYLKLLDISTRLSASGTPGTDPASAPAQLANSPQKPELQGK